MRTEPISAIREQLRIRKLKCRLRTVMLAGAARTMMMVLLGVVLFNLAFGICTVNGNDMYPAVRDGDCVIYYRHADYMNSDVVLFRNQEKSIIGRIEAVYGSELSVSGDGQITIDGNLQPVQPRCGIFSPTSARTDGVMSYPYAVKSDEFFILGDNREVATDSRSVGCIGKNDIEGKVIAVIRRRSV